MQVPGAFVSLHKALYVDQLLDLGVLSHLATKKTTT